MMRTILVLALLLIACPATAQTDRIDVYRPNGQRSTYIVTDRNGVSQVYDSRTSQRLGWFRSPSEAYRPDGRRIPGGAPALVLPPTTTKGGKR